MSADTYDCELCGAIVFMSQRAHHEANLCPVLQRRQKKPPKPKRKRRAQKASQPSKVRGKPAKCALEECGAEFISQGTYHRFCCPRHADVARNGDMDEADEARQAAEMAPLAREAELFRRAAEAVPMLSPEASHALWLRCLGVAA